jgi:hypothetical protein
LRPPGLKDYHQSAVAIRSQMQRHQAHGPWFTNDWWHRHGVLFPPWHYHHHHHPHHYWWRPMTWEIFVTWMPVVWAPPVYFDYGVNVVYRDNYVYVNDVPVAPAPEYASQAQELARVTPPPEPKKIEWMPLGTFALADTKDARNADLVLQLAISKEGLISGICFNRTNDKVVAVEGRVDPATQRVAIRFPEDDDFVLETGIYNLTQDQAPALMHVGTQRTQHWFLVRLEQPAAG